MNLRQRIREWKASLWVAIIFSVAGAVFFSVFSNFGRDGFDTDAEWQMWQASMIALAILFPVILLGTFFVLSFGDLKENKKMSTLKEKGKTKENLGNSLSNTDSKNNISYNGCCQTIEQEKRDKAITDLLKKYVDAYAEKTHIQRTCRKWLIGLCAAVIFIFSVVFAIFLLYFIFAIQSEMDIKNIISLISVCLVFPISIFGLLKIITKYCFPQNDEEYITRIVEAIQKNDLENKKENMKNMLKNSKEKTKD